MKNLKNSTSEESKFPLLSNAAAFFQAARQTSEDCCPVFSVEKCKEFFEITDDLLKEVSFVSKDDISSILDSSTKFFEKAQQVSAESDDTEINLLNKCKEFFLKAKAVTKEVDSQLLIKEFQVFCEDVRIIMLNQYRKWIDFIQISWKGNIEKINLLKVFGVSGKEDAHSKFLTWMLKEEESHGLGNLFLKYFMDAVKEKYSNVKNISLEGVNVIPESSGENGIPDIKIVGNDFLCIVENKIRAMEGKDQTKRYAKDALGEIKRRGIADKRLFLIFLTPTGRSALDERFKTMNYDEIINILKSTLQSQKNIIDLARILIEQFILNLNMEIHDIDKKIAKCLKQYSKSDDKYLWDDYENIGNIYDQLIKKEV